MRRESDIFVRYHMQLHYVAKLIQKGLTAVAMAEAGRLCGLAYALNRSEERVVRDLQMVLELEENNVN